jgi:nucleoside-diphosphate kinase
MAVERTLCIIKPDVCEKRQQGTVLQRLLDEGFSLIAMRQVHLSRAQAEGFYAVHRERSFFPELCSFMTRGPIVVLALRADNAVTHLRNVIGATDPQKAKPGTVRQLFGASVSENAVHGSDSVENGLRECAYFFAESELM